jgi:hypothetical protein
MQSRRMSMIEVATNITIGLVVSFISQIAIFKLYDITHLCHAEYRDHYLVYCNQHYSQLFDPQVV